MNRTKCIPDLTVCRGHVMTQVFSSLIQQDLFAFSVRNCTSYEDDKDTPSSLRNTLFENQTKLLDENIMKLVQKCCAAMPFPLLITVCVGVDSDAFFTKFSFFSSITDFQDYSERSWGVLNKLAYQKC